MHSNDLPFTIEYLRQVFSLIDLTTLNTDDGSSKIIRLCRQLNEFPAVFPGMPQVAAICVYPVFIPLVRANLKAAGVECASVSAGFPAAQTYPEVKELESRMAVEAGADEVDIVLSVGRFLEGDEDFVREEISRIKAIVSPVKLKVILETGLLPDDTQVYRASMLSMEAGADFIKTSTGKLQPAASIEAVRIMCQAIRDFYEKKRKDDWHQACGWNQYQ